MEMSSKYQKSGMFGNPSHPKSSCSSIYDIACIPQPSGQGSPAIGSLEACCFSIKSVMQQVGSNTWEAAEVHHVGCDTMLLSQEKWYTGQQWSVPVNLAMKLRFILFFTLLNPSVEITGSCTDTVNWMENSGSKVIFVCLCQETVCQHIMKN